MGTKEEKEAFVSGFDGTSVLEISTVASSAPLALLLQFALSNWLYYQYKPHVGVKFFLELLTLVLPLLLAFTLLSSFIDGFFTYVFFLSFGLLVFTLSINRKQFPERAQNFTFSKLLQASCHSPSFITHFRAYVLVATALCILAVDFPVFPRRYCKAETFGTGLMDVGVGAFIVSNALVAPEARGKGKLCRSLGDWLTTLHASIPWPLVLLGLIRTALVSLSGYQEHVSEYGVHWNFFFTLAVVKVMSTAALSLLPLPVCFSLGVATICTYQTLLQSSDFNLQELVLLGSDGQGTRDGLLNANREGLASCLGYISLYLLFLPIAKYLHQDRPQTVSSHLNTLATLVILDAVLWILLLFSPHVGLDQVSRRVANLPYVVWMLAYNLQMLASFLLVDMLKVTCFEAGISLPHKVQSHFFLLESVNYNGLVYFLLANVLTGLVNMNVDTLNMTNVPAFFILFVYMVILCGASSWLHLSKIKVKFA